jgi:hypothetical protein
MLMPAVSIIATKNNVSILYFMLHPPYIVISKCDFRISFYNLNIMLNLKILLCLFVENVKKIGFESLSNYIHMS